MFFRHRLVLALLERAGKPLDPTTLVKLAFLLRQETAVGGDKTFYSFVPYRLGPFSFSLYRELNGLARDGYVLRTDKHVRLNPEALDLSREKIAELSACQRESVDVVVSKYGRMRWRSLIESVYERYPWYAINSELSDFLPDNPPAVPAVRTAAYTVGYEGKSVDAFFNGLLEAGIKAVSDVRANPISRKYGFAKRSLSEIARRLGVTYYHLPELGIDSVHRSGLQDFDSYQRLLDQYERDVLPRRSSNIRYLAKLLKKEPSAILCVEKDVRCCHRGRLAKAVGAVSGLPVIHLQ